MSFNSIIGNDAIKNLLTNTIISKNILHSYMFIGEDGIGKFLFAKEFAKNILCENPINGSFCDNCKSCIEFNTNNHPDFLVINPDDGKSIKIEQVRYLQERVAEKPIVSSKKVYIINDSHLMTKEAQNCLLKTLEEPPEYTVIILVLSNENKLLNTIKSRCTKINFSKLSAEEIVEYFHRNLQDFEVTSTLLKVYSGSIGKALNLRKETAIYQDLDKMLENLQSSDIVDLWNNSDILYKSKDTINDLLEYINVVFMEYLVQTNDIRYGNCIKIVEITKNRLLSNANYDMSIDNLLFNIWEEFHEKYSRC